MPGGDKIAQRKKGCSHKKDSVYVSVMIERGLDKWLMHMYEWMHAVRLDLVSI